MYKLKYQTETYSKGPIQTNLPRFQASHTQFLTCETHVWLH